MSNQIVVLVDDKQNVLEALEFILAGGHGYADQCLRVLVAQYGADEDLVDMETLRESCTGHVINCTIKGKDPNPPTEYISWLLFGRSDIGLSKLGLTRQPYIRAVAVLKNRNQEEDRGDRTDGQ